jgi:hypothetical protein
MLQFLKKLFSNDDEVAVLLPQQTVLFSELPAWLEKHTSQHAKSIAATARPLLDKIDDTIFAAEANLAKLEHAELRNKNINGREFSIMKGNRASYIQRTRQFLEEFRSLYDKDAITYADMKQFVEIYARSVADLNKALLKPYAVLQYFFANESYAVANHIKQIDTHMKELEQLLKKESQEAIAHCKEQIVIIKQKLDLQKKLQAEKEELEQDCARLEELEQQAAQKLAKVEASEGYQDYQHCFVEKEAQDKKVQEKVAELQHSFSVIDKALRKYAKQEEQHAACIETTLSNPLSVILENQTEALLSVLQSVRQALATDALDIKEDKKEKMLAEIDRISTRDFFSAFVQEYRALEEEQKLLEKKMKFHVACQQYKEAQYMFSTYKEKKDVLRKRTGELAAALEKMSIPQLLAQLEKDLHECTTFDVKILI